MKNKNIILLCGGLSKRVFKYINVPKPLFEINKVSVIENNLNILKKNLIKEQNIFININNKHKKYYEEFISKNNCNYIFENNALGTAGSVRNIIKKYNLESTYVIYGDQFYNYYFLKEILNLNIETNSIFTIKNGDISKSGVAIYDNDFNLVNFEEKPNNFKPLTSTFFSINIGIYYFNNFDFFNSTHDKRELDFGKDIFPNLYENEIKIIPIKSKNYPIFIDDITRIDKIKK